MASDKAGAAPPPRNLTVNLTAFVRLLRANGITVGPGEAADALRASTVSDLLDRREFYFALRTVLVHSVDAYPVFDTLFRAFWRAEDREPAPRSEDEAVPTPAEEGTPSVAEAAAEPAPSDGGMPGDGEMGEQDWQTGDGSPGRPAGEPGESDQEGSPPPRHDRRLGGRNPDRRRPLRATDGSDADRAALPRRSGARPQPGEASCSWNGC